MEQNGSKWLKGTVKATERRYYSRRSSMFALLKYAIFNNRDRNEEDRKILVDKIERYQKGIIINISKQCFKQ